MDSIVKAAKVIGVVVATVTAVGLLADLKDIKRYLHMNTI